MAAILDNAKNVYAAGPSSAPTEPSKSDIIRLFGLIEAILGSAVNGLVVGSAVVYQTRAALFANLARPDGSLGIVYGDSNPAYNGVYVKAGASGTGSWTLTNLALPSTFAAELAGVVAAQAATASEVIAARQGSPSVGDRIAAVLNWSNEQDAGQNEFFNDRIDAVSSAQGATQSEVTAARSGSNNLTERLNLILDTALDQSDAVQGYLTGIINGQATASEQRDAALGVRIDNEATARGATQSEVTAARGGLPNLAARLQALADAIAAGGGEAGEAIAAVASDLNQEIANRQTAIATAIASLLDSAPGTLDTLNELAAALGDDPNFATTIANSLADIRAGNFGKISANLTAGATIDLSLATGDYVPVIGMGATVTSFGSATGGVRKVIRWAQAGNVLVHDPNVIDIQGGPNIETQAGDISEWESMGSNRWRLLWYRPADGKTTSLRDFWKISDAVASAATVDLAAAKGDYVAISGAEIISSFSTFIEGTPNLPIGGNARKIVRFLNSGAKLVHASSGNGSIDLPTKADIIAAENDMAEFIYVGSGSWRCLWYARSDGMAVGQPYADDRSKAVIDSAGAVIFSGDGQSVLEVADQSRDSLVIGTAERAIGTLDTIDDALMLRAIGVAPGDSVRVNDGSDTEELSYSTEAKVFADAFGRGLRIDSVNKQIVSNYKIVQDLEPADVTLRTAEGPLVVKDLTPAKYQLSGRKVQMTSTMARVGNKFWVAWRADNNFASEYYGNYIVVGYSDDNFSTFSEHAVIDYPIIGAQPYHDYQLIDPMLWTDPEGSLWLFFSVAKGQAGTTGHVDGVLGCWAVVCTNPSASRTVWSKPFRFHPWGDPRHPIKMRGEWYIAIDMWRNAADTPPVYPDTAGPHLYKLDWRNKRVERVSKLPPNQSDGVNWTGFFETEFVELSNGDMMAAVRSASGSDGPDVCRSFDGGKTWTGYSKGLSALGNYSGSRIWVDHTPSGRLMVVYNNDTVRRTLTIALSEDDGVTFPYKKVVEPIFTSADGPQLTYPVVAYGANGEIFVTYDGGRIGSPRSIRVAKLIESEIVAGTSTPEIHIISERVGA